LNCPLAHTTQVSNDIIWEDGVPGAPLLPTGATITAIVAEAENGSAPNSAKFANGKNVLIEVKQEDISRELVGAK